MFTCVMRGLLHPILAGIAFFNVWSCLADAKPAAVISRASGARAEENQNPMRIWPAELLFETADPCHPSDDAAAVRFPIVRERFLIIFPDSLE